MALRTERIAPRTRLLRPTAVNTILAEVRRLQAQGRKLVSLMRGEPDFRTPPHIVEAAVRALHDGRTSYPDNRGEPVLREAIAQKLDRQNGLRYDPTTEILVTTGATFGIYTALAALLDEEDEILLPDPVYDAYESPVRLVGGRPVSMRASIENGRFCLTTEALERAYTPRTRGILINTPWNPTGTVFTRPELEAILRFAEERDLFVISDEIYEAITYDGAVHVSPASLSESARERTILVNSFSKSYAMTGWRAGYCAAPPEVIKAMLLVLQQSSRGPALFVQDAATVALTGPQECVAEMRDEYTRRRRQVIERLSGLRGVQVLAPEGGFFAMVDVRQFGEPSNEIRKRLLEEAGVVVIHGSAYGEGGEGTLRVSFASGGETLARGLDLLREGLSR